MGTSVRAIGTAARARDRVRGPHRAAEIPREAFGLRAGGVRLGTREAGPPYRAPGFKAGLGWSNSWVT